MNELPDQNCKNCPHGNKCSEVYKKLGETGCQPVTTSVSIAFLLPMVVFILTVVIFNEYCGDWFENKTKASLISLVAGVLAATVSVYAARLLRGKTKN